MDFSRKLLKSKLHRATVTEADLNYEGSVTIPSQLLEAADIVEYEAVSVWNITNGSRFETYAITGPKKSSNICVNGAAARLVSPGDLVIIASFISIPNSKIYAHKPKVIFLDQNNRIKEVRLEIAGNK